MKPMGHTHQNVIEALSSASDADHSLASSNKSSSARGRVLPKETVSTVKLLKNELKRNIKRLKSKHSLNEALKKSQWSISYNLLTENAAPFGHNFMTINEHVYNPQTKQEDVFIRVVVGNVGGLGPYDLFGLHTKRSKINDETLRIQHADKIQQISWKITDEQLSLLLVRINHDRQEGLEKLHPVILPDIEDTANHSKSDTRRIKKYHERFKIKREESVLQADGTRKKQVSYLVDNPGGPTYSVICFTGTNCKAYGLSLLHMIGINNAALSDLFVQVPICGHKLKPAQIIDNQSIDTMKWDTTLFNQSLQRVKPFDSNFIGYTIDLIKYNFLRLIDTCRGLGLTHLLFIAGSCFLVATAVSIILAVTFGIGAIPASSLLMTLLGSNVVLSVLSGLTLLAGGVAGAFYSGKSFLSLWKKNIDMFVPSKKPAHPDNSPPSTASIPQLSTEISSSQDSSASSELDQAETKGNENVTSLHVEQPALASFTG